MSRRLEMLEKLIASGNEDPFARYGLAMEYRQLERFAEAERVFTELRERSPDYLAMYLMAGQMLLGCARPADATTWLQQGIAVAQRQHNTKALSELEGALAEAQAQIGGA